MVMNKVGLNLSVLNNITPPNISIPGNAQEAADQMVTAANSQTLNYFGMGFMLTLFLFLVYKIGRGDEFHNEQFGAIRAVGISACVVGMIGIWATLLGFFTEYYHVVIFIGIAFLAQIIIIIGSR